MRGYAAENSVQVQLVGHFGLRENPFGVTPDPRFLFLSQTHREALASLVNGIDCDFGFQVLVAQPGMGKTTLLFNFLERFRTTAHTVFLFQPQLNPHELFQSVLFELGISSNETSLRKLSEQLNGVLSRAAQSRKRVIVVLDEAQNLDFAVLEALRQLSNFETASVKLMQIVLAGQPQLAKRLASPEQEQLMQRISAIGRLRPLALNEAQAYINHRLRTAGYKGGDLFTEGAVRNIWHHSRGVPRNINTLCFSAMLLAFAEHAKSIDERILEEAARDLDLNHVLADLYQMEPSAAISGNGRLHLVKETKPAETSNARPGATEVEGPTSILRETGTTAPAARSSNDSAAGAGENIPPALVEALARISQVLEEQKALLAANSVPLAEALAAAVPTIAAALAPMVPADSTAAVAVEAPANPDHASQAQPSAQVKSSAAVGNRDESATNPAKGSPVEERNRSERKPTSNTVQLPPKHNVISAPPAPHKHRTVAEKRPKKGSDWPKVLSLAAIIGILAFVVVEKSPLQRLLTQVGSLATGSSGVGPNDSTSGRPVSSDVPASPMDAPSPTPKNTTTDPRGPRNTRSRDFEDVIVRKFPTDSDASSEASGDTQKLKPIFFEQDSAVIGSQDRASLQKIADALAESPEASVILEGHTDSTGQEAYNLDLSSRRAIAVRNALVNEFRVSTTRLTAIGQGSTAPVQPNSSAAGRAYNRRVEVRWVHLGE